MELFCKEKEEAHARKKRQGPEKVESTGQENTMILTCWHM
jgi:hypothetical protein